jgi:hypothetical protein
VTLHHALALAVCLSVGSPGMLARAPSQAARLVKVVATPDGVVGVWSLPSGCRLDWRGVVMQVVDRRTCAA